MEDEPGFLQRDDKFPRTNKILAIKRDPEELRIGIAVPEKGLEDNFKYL